MVLGSSWEGGKVEGLQGDLTGTRKTFLISVLSPQRSLCWSTPWILWNRLGLSFDVQRSGVLRRSNRAWWSTSDLDRGRPIQGRQWWRSCFSRLQARGRRMAQFICLWTQKKRWELNSARATEDEGVSVAPQSSSLGKGKRGRRELKIGARTEVIERQGEISPAQALRKQIASFSTGVAVDSLSISVASRWLKWCQHKTARFLRSGWSSL